MEDSIISIPSVTAFHVLNNREVALGSGELGLFAASSAEKDLLLTVGAAAFKLQHDTHFGTIENDPRSYVFSPQIEGVTGGYAVS